MEAVPAWTAALISGGIFCIVAGYNAWIAWQRFVVRTPAPSLAPFIGGIAGLGAVIAMPVADLSVRLPYGLIPLVLDAGCLPYLAVVYWAVFSNRRA